MKLLHILAAAGLAVTTLAAAAPAEAQHMRDHRGYHDDRGRHHGWDRGRGHGWDRGHRYGRHCRVEWRHHHRVRICR